MALLVLELESGDRAPVTVRRWRPPLRWRRALALAVSLVVLFSALTARLFIWPDQGVPSHVSAVIMLAGSDGRLAVALRLARERRAPTLVISRGHQGYAGPCPVLRDEPVTVICFEPDPSDTRGEAEFAGRLAQEGHWTSVILVAGRPQDTRARMLMSRCFDGPVYVETAQPRLSEWPSQVAYEWGALLKALVVQRTC